MNVALPGIVATAGAETVAGELGEAGEAGRGATSAQARGARATSARSEESERIRRAYCVPPARPPRTALARGGRCG